MPLRRYWLTFESEQTPVELGHGCGVTAFDLDDALDLVAERIGSTVPAPSSVTEDVDVSTLDAGHVLPNMLPPNERGVWFPMTTYR
ncbi:MAG: hypothetical protein ACSLFP_16350 [Acidimicrobiales bacterium]